jgi:NADH-ubiquinone oxidoreductase chain 2
LSAVSSSIIGAWGGINQNNFKLILTFSSVAHGGWLIFLSPTSIRITVLYFLVYTLTVVFVVWILNYTKKRRIKSANIRSLRIEKKILFSLNILSLGGLPPFVGFTVKVLTIYFLLNFAPLPILFTLILSSLITLIFYLKIIFPSVPLKTMPLKIFLLAFKTSKSISFLFFFVLILNLSFSLLILLT